MYIFKLSIRHHWNLATCGIHVNTFKNDCLHPEADDGEFSLSSSARLALTWHTNPLHFVTHRSTISQFSTSVTSTIADSINGTYPQPQLRTPFCEFSLTCACPVGKHSYLLSTHLLQLTACTCECKVCTLYWSSQCCTSFLPKHCTVVLLKEHHELVPRFTVAIVSYSQ